MSELLTRREYLFHACRAEAWRRLTWRMSIFNVCRFPKDKEPKEYDVTFNEDGVPMYYAVVSDDNDTGTQYEWRMFADAKPNEEIFWPEEELAVPKEELWGIDQDIISTPGRFITNWIVLRFAFGTKLPYLAEGGSFLVYEKEIYSRCLKNEEDEPENTTAIRPSEVDRFLQALYEVSPMCMAVVPTGTLNSLVTDPEVYKVRDQFLKDNADRLDDPSVVVELIEKLEKIDRAWLSKDQSIDFYSSKKARMRRRKLLIIGGIESAFREDGKYTLIAKSLSEETELTHAVERFNSIRDGSFSRGAETAKGGEQVRIIQMIFQNHRVVEGDCGTKLTHPTIFTEYNRKRYLGMNAVVDGKLVVITEDFVAKNQGKLVRLRRPILCQQGHVDKCSACTSTSKPDEERAVGNDIAAGASNIMLNAMGAMHGRDTVVAEFKPQLHIS